MSKRTIAELVRQIADAYDPTDEVETCILKAGGDPEPILWPQARTGGFVPPVADREN